MKIKVSPSGSSTGSLLHIMPSRSRRSYRDVLAGPGGNSRPALETLSMGKKEFQFTITVNGEHYGKRFFSIRPGESMDHVVLKLIASLLYAHEKPEVEHPTGWKYRPDVTVFDEKGAVKRWIECADTAPSKLRRVLGRFPQAEVVVFKRLHHEAESFARFFLRERQGGASIVVKAFEADFVDTLCRIIFDRASLRAEYAGGMLTLTCGDVTIFSPVYSC
ncbi:MAG: YaeQ family protein [Candidatus Eremiobacteraeota bacterium]|nr:YaeQ family protein [Candidatus Eremiobacteraeota bacterium]